MNPIIKSACFAWLLLLPLLGSSQSFELSDKANVSVLTCGVGNEMYSLFGHTAIRITDPERNFDMVYNYGAFDFDTPNFVVQFSKGNLQYFVTSENFDDFLNVYDFDQRSVWEQQLAMTIREKQFLFNELNTTMATDKKYYTYKFIDRNCTTMVVDILNKAYGKNVIIKSDRTEETFREVLFPYFDNHFYEQLGTSIIFGAKVDQKAAHIFLPIELWENLNQTSVNGAPVVVGKKTWLSFEVPATDGMWWNNWYTYILLLVLIVAVNSRIVTFLYLIFAGLIGLFFSFGGLYSEHAELSFNYNALLFNPAMLLLAIFMLIKNGRLVFFASVFCIASIVLYVFFMLGKIHLLIVLPLIIAHLYIMARFIRRYRKSRLIRQEKTEDRLETAPN